MGVGRWRTELADEVWPSDTAQALLYAATFFRLVPEKVLALGQFVALCLGTAYRLQCIRVVARVPRLG